MTGLSVNGSLEYYFTQLTTLSGSSGAMTTRMGVGVDHELLRNVILRGDLNYTQADYRGIERTDDIVSASFGAIYKLNRNLYTQAAYTYETRSSDAAGSDFSDNLVMLRVGGQF